MTDDTALPNRRRKALSRDSIIDAAFGIVDSEGAAALSARRLARELKVEAMSLYHHLPNMDAVLDQLVERLLSQCLTPLMGAIPVTPDRRDVTKIASQLTPMAHAFLALAAQHPHIFLLAVSRPWVTPSALSLMQISASAFQSAGATPSQALCCARILGAYLGGAGNSIAGWKLAAGKNLEPRLNATIPQKESSTGLEQSPQKARLKLAMQAVDTDSFAESKQCDVFRDVRIGVDLLIDSLLKNFANVENLLPHEYLADRQ
jgi:AcrR family transcriptional regulator